MLKTTILSLNVKNLKELITAYQSNYDEDPNFIIMNSDTERVLRTEIDDADIKMESQNENIKTTFSTFWGIPIAICNKFNYGDVYIV